MRLLAEVAKEVTKIIELYSYVESNRPGRRKMIYHGGCFSVRVDMVDSDRLSEITGGNMTCNKLNLQLETGSCQEGS